MRRSFTSSSARRRRLGASVAAGALVLAACGGGSSDDSATGAEAGQPLPAATDATSEPDTDTSAQTEPAQADPGATDPAASAPVESGSTDGGAADPEPAQAEPAAVASGLIDLVGPEIQASADVATNQLPDVVVDDLNNGRKVNFRNLVPQELPILLWMWAPH